MEFNATKMLLLKRHLCVGGSLRKTHVCKVLLVMCSCLETVLFDSISHKLVNERPYSNLEYGVLNVDQAVSSPQQLQILISQLLCHQITPKGCIGDLGESFPQVLQSIPKIRITLKLEESITDKQAKRKHHDSYIILLYAVSVFHDNSYRNYGFIIMKRKHGSLLAYIA